MKAAFLMPKYRLAYLITIAGLLFLSASSLIASPGVFTYEKDSFSYNVSYNEGVIHGDLKRIAGHPFADSGVKPLKTAYLFDGKSYIDVVGMKKFTLAGADSFAISVWIKPVRQYEDPDASPIVSKWNKAGRGEFFLSVDSDGRLNFGRNFPGGALTSDGFVKFNRWNHVAVSYDGTRIRIYINGKPRGSIESRTIVSAVPNTPMIVGAWYENGIITSRYRGSIEDIRIYNRALSADAVASLSVDNEIYGKKTSQAGDIAEDDFAALAIDGDMNSFSRTAKQLYPWWKVDLGNNYNIAKAVIHRGPDCEWPKGFADRYFSLELDGKRIFEGAAPPTDKWPMQIDLDQLEGRELKIQLYGKNACLQIKEVKISAKPTVLTHINAALNKVASQSPTFKNSSSYSAEKAVDGDLNTFAKTDKLSFPQRNFWKVHLGRAYYINKIKILSSPDCPDCWKDLDRFSIYIDGQRSCPLEVNGRSVCLPDKGVCDMRCDDIRVSDNDPVTINFQDKNIRGENIEIRRTFFDEPLSLGEVEIYGVADID